MEFSPSVGEESPVTLEALQFPLMAREYMPALFRPADLDKGFRRETEQGTIGSTRLP